MGFPKPRKGATDISALTSIRGFAAWWVVLFHIRGQFEPHVGPSLWRLLSNGYLAVDMFFALSGFVLYLNYAGRLSATRASYTDFVVRRIARIYPLHLLLLLPTIVYGLIYVYRAGTPSDVYSLGTLPLHLLLIHNWGFTDTLGWNIPSWSISTEFFAYLLFPLVMLLTADWRRLPSWLLVGLILLLAALLHAVFRLREAALLGEQIPSLGLLRCAVQFLIGTLSCALYRRLKGRVGGVAPILLLLTAAGMVAAVVRGWPETFLMPLIWATFVLGVALLPNDTRNPLTWRPFVYLGEISYATYLCHYVAFIAFKLFIVDSSGVASPVALTLFIIGILGLSALLYQGFERPAQRWLLDRWRTRTAGGLARSAARS